MRINRLFLSAGLILPMITYGTLEAAAVPPVEDRYAHSSAFLNEAFFNANAPRSVFEAVTDRQAATNRRCRSLEDTIKIQEQFVKSTFKRLTEARQELRQTLKRVREAPAVLTRLKARLKTTSQGGPIGLIERGIELAQNTISRKQILIRQAERSVAFQRKELAESKAELARLKQQLEDCREQLRIAGASSPAPALTQNNLGTTQISPTSFNRAEALSAGGVPVTLFVGLDYAGLDDNRNLIDRNADILSIVFGGAFQVSPRTSLGISGIVQTGKTTSTAMNSKLTGTYFGFAVFANHLINEHFTVKGSVGYRHGRNKVRLNLASTKFNTSALTASGALTGHFKLGTLDFKPGASIDIARVWNGNTVFTNAIAQNKLARTHARFAIGATISKDFVGVSGIITPSLGVNGVYQHRSGFRFTTFTFQRAAELGLGADFTAGVTLKTYGGMTAALNGNFGLFKKVKTYGARATLAVPLN